MLLHVQKSPSNWIRGIGLRCSPLICQITVNLPRHRMKSQRERVKKRWEEEEGILQGPRYPSRLSAKPNSSSFASCFQEIWCGCDVWVQGDTIRTVANMAAEEKKKKTGRKKVTKTLLNNDISVFSTSILDPCSQTCTWRQITCFYELIAGTKAVSKMTHWHHSS